MEASWPWGGSQLCWQDCKLHFPGQDWEGERACEPESELEKVISEIYIFKPAFCFQYFPFVSMFVSFVNEWPILKTDSSQL